MDMKKFLDMEVIDIDGQNVGKIETVEFDQKFGEIKKVIIKLDKGIFSRSKESITFGNIDKIKDVVLLNIKIDMDK